MIQCLIWLLIMALIVVIVLWIIETAVAQITPLPKGVSVLLRLIAGLIVLLYALACLGMLAPPPWPHPPLRP